MATTLERTYLDRFKGCKGAAAYALARDLMQGDTARCKLGYTPTNAMLAARELLDLDAEQSRSLCRDLGMEPADWGRYVEENLAALDDAALDAEREER